MRRDNNVPVVHQQCTIVAARFIALMAKY